MIAGLNLRYAATAEFYRQEKQGSILHFYARQSHGGKIQKDFR